MAGKFEVFVNQAGYQIKGEKYALAPFDFGGFCIVDKNNKVFYSGKAVNLGEDVNSGDVVYAAFFSDFEEEGEYFVKTEDGKCSSSFSIGRNTEETALEKLEKAFYFLRCGMDLEESYAGRFTHKRCHTGTARLWSDRSKFLEVSGGWHDAGDYGRYVTPGAVAAAQLLYAYKLYPSVFEKQNLNIPESGNGTPDILSEARYELEWLLKMQRSDGGVYHKATTALHAAFVMPEEDVNPMFVFDVSSMATADFAAVCTLASGIYRPFDEEFSKLLMTAAEKSYKWLRDNPDFLPFRNPKGNGTGWYGEWSDLDNRFWAACEMFAATGDESCQLELEKLIDAEMPRIERWAFGGGKISLTELGYAVTGGFGALAYLLCDRENRKPELIERFENAFLMKAEELKKISDGCGYLVAMREGEYCWGSNMNLMKNGMLFCIADLLKKKKGEESDFLKYAARQMNCLFGANALGISYVSGVGEYCINNPHLRPAFADGIDECIPGMVAGGPNGKPCNNDREIVSFPEGTPPMKCFEDDYRCFSLNEITIYWNSPAVFTLAGVIKG